MLTQDIKTYDEFIDEVCDLASKLFDTEEDSNFSHGIIFHVDGKKEMILFDGGVGPSQKLRMMETQASKETTLYAALIFETWSVESDSPEAHAANVAKYGPKYMHWPDELLTEKLCITIDGRHEEPRFYEGHIDSSGTGDTSRQLGEIKPRKGKVSGRMTRFFPETDRSKTVC